MAVYLSSDWLDEVNRAARADAGLEASTAGARVTIQQVVTGGPSGDVRYWVRVNDGAVEVGAGEAAVADATVTQSYTTAVALSRGELTVEDALQAGLCRIAGDIALLVRHQSALLGVGGVLAVVHPRTSYEES